MGTTFTTFSRFNVFTLSLNTGKFSKVHALQEGHGISINFNIGKLEGRFFRNVVILTFTFFFLKLEGNTTDRTLLNTTHQVGGETGNLVTKTLAGDDGNFGSEALVSLEIQSQTGVVLFNENLGSSLNSLGTNATLYNRNQRIVIRVKFVINS